MQGQSKEKEYLETIQEGGNMEKQTSTARRDGAD